MEGVDIVASVVVVIDDNGPLGRTNDDNLYSVSIIGCERAADAVVEFIFLFTLLLCNQ